jgi:hypothetical protein
MDYWRKQASGLSLNAFAQVSTTDLQPGDYTLQWEGNGPDVQVKVLKAKNVVATVPAKLAQGTSVYDNTVATRTVGNMKTLDEVDFAGGKQSLIFGEETATQSSGGQQ